MTRDFDPYDEWLQIPPDRRPPSHYDLLGVPENETDSGRIDEAATQRIQRVRARALGELGEYVTPLLNEISQALDCLTTSGSREVYDEGRLRRSLDRWLETFRQPVDFYELVDARRFTPDRAHLLGAIRSARWYLEGRSAAGDADQDQVAELQGELDAAEDAFSSPSGFRQYHEPILARLLSEYIERHGEDERLWDLTTLEEWLERDERVHPDRSGPIAWAMSDPDGEMWDRLLIDLFPTGRASAARALEPWLVDLEEQRQRPHTPEGLERLRQKPPKLPSLPASDLDGDFDSEQPVRSNSGAPDERPARFARWVVPGLIILGCLALVVFVLLRIRQSETPPPRGEIEPFPTMAAVPQQGDVEDLEPLPEGLTEPGTEVEPSGGETNDVPDDPETPPNEGLETPPLPEPDDGENLAEEPAPSSPPEASEAAPRESQSPALPPKPDEVAPAEMLADSLLPKPQTPVEGESGESKPPKPAPPEAQELEMKSPAETASQGPAFVRAFAIEAHVGPVQKVAFSPDGREVATAGDQAARLWDSQTGRRIRAFEEHFQLVTDVAWFPQNGGGSGRSLARIATSSRDGIVRVFSIAAGRARLESFNTLSRVLCLTWSPDGARLAAGLASGELYVANPNPGGGGQQRMPSSFESIQAIAWHPTNPNLIVLGDETGFIWVWDLARGLPVCGRIDRKSLQFRAMIVANPRLAQMAQSRAILLTERPVKPCRQLAWSPDGRRLAAVEGGIEIWNYSRLEGLGWSPTQMGEAEFPEIPSQTEDTALSQKGEEEESSTRMRYRAVAWRPDGRRLAAGTADGAVIVFDASDGRKLHEMQCPTEVGSVAWSPDGKRIAAGASDGMLTVWRERE
jgi:WD40 repeat protein